MILEVKNLSIKFGELAACENINFEIEKGEVFGVAGPNGAGKTTLFNCIAGVYRNSGTILFEGHNITNLTQDRICHLGIARTFQIPTIFNSMTVSQNIEVGAYFGRGIKNKKKEMGEIIDLLKLKGKENFTSSSLNLFDRKMAMLAVALVTKPRLLLLDEPMGGLSPSEVADCIEIVKKINVNFGISIIIIEHLMKVITGVSSRLMILDNGKVIKIGNPLEVCGDKKVIEVYLGTVEQNA